MEFVEKLGNNIKTLTPLRHLNMSQPKSKLFVLGVIFVLLVMAVPVLAGDWATIKLTEVPSEIRTDEEIAITFQVLQHDNKLVQTFPPQVSATHVESGQAITTVAQPNKADLSFEARLTLPEPGAWEWTIDPMPLDSATSFEPLEVQPALEPIAADARQRLIGQTLSESMALIIGQVLYLLCLA